MRLVRVSWVKEQMELAQDIPSAVLGAAPLLRRGVHLTPSLALKLGNLGVRAVWIEDDMGDGIIPLQPLQVHARNAFETAVSGLLHAARNGADGNTLAARALPQIEQAASAMLDALSDGPDGAVLAFDDLASADTYLYSHSVRVATLGLLIGQRMDRRDGWVDYKGQVRHDRFVERMTQLTIGLLMHDVGKMTIPDSILTKPGELSEEEWIALREHATAGAAILSSERISPLSRSIVRDHHERWDGSGYPSGRQGEDIHQFARIAAVADVYDAITSDRPYRPAGAPHIGVETIRAGSGTLFDPQVVAHFCRTAMPYPVGYTLSLPDGSRGAVVSVDPEHPEVPVIRFHAPDGQLIEAPMRLVDGIAQPQDSPPLAPAAPSAGSAWSSVA